MDGFDCRRLEDAIGFESHDGDLAPAVFLTEVAVEPGDVVVIGKLAEDIGVDLQVFKEETQYQGDEDSGHDNRYAISDDSARKTHLWLLSRAPCDVAGWFK